MTTRNPGPCSTLGPGIRGAPRYLVPALALLLIVIAVGLVALSPFALDVFGNSRAWTERSEIGQTYGAAAALLSVLALVGISVSLILQAREAKAAREHASRVTHSELLQMAIEDPVYRECWGPVDHSRSERELQQHIYTNLIVSYWQSRFELGMFSEAHLRAGASEMFAAVPGRRFWAATRNVRRETAQTRRARRFHRILDEEYDRAIAAGPPTADRPSAPQVRFRRGRRVTGFIVAGAGVVAGLRLLYRELVRHRA